jgi:hypothetical protein
MSVESAAAPPQEQRYKPDLIIPVTPAGGGIGPDTITPIAKSTENQACADG